MALHIVDALFLYGQDYRNHSYNMRVEACTMFVNSIHRPSRKTLSPVRVKTLCRVEDLPSALHTHTSYRSVASYVVHNQPVCFVGVLFLGFLKVPQC